MASKGCHALHLDLAMRLAVAGHRSGSAATFVRGRLDGGLRRLESSRKRQPWDGLSRRGLSFRQRAQRNGSSCGHSLSGVGRWRIAASAADYGPPIIRLRAPGRGGFFCDKGESFGYHSRAESGGSLPLIKSAGRGGTGWLKGPVVALAALGGGKGE